MDHFMELKGRNIKRKEEVNKKKGRNIERKEVVKKKKQK